MPLSMYLPIPRAIVVLTDAQDQGRGCAAVVDQFNNGNNERDKVLATVHDLEMKLGIIDRWRPSSAKGRRQQRWWLGGRTNDVWIN